MGRTSILIVEDEGIVARDLAECLAEMGYAVAGTVASGEDAIAQAAVTRPDLVLMDIVLRGEMDGITAAEEIHSRFNIPIIFLTAYPQEFSLDRIKATEPFGYLGKPVGREQLRGSVETALYKHQIETRLRESEEKYRKLVDALPEGIYVDKIGEAIVFANEAMARILGEESAEALIGRRALDMVHPDYHEGFVARAHRVHHFNEAVPFLERKLIRKDGSSIAVEMAATPLMLGGEACAQVVVRDITERKSVEVALRKSEAFLNSIIEQSPMSIGILDEHGTAIRQNQACRDLYEAGDEELMGKYNIFKDEVLAAHGLLPDIRRIFDHGESINVTLDYDFAKVRHCQVARTGAKAVEVTLFPVKDLAGKVTNVVIQTKDVGKIKQAESALRASEERYRTLFERAGDGILILDARDNPLGRILSANHRAAEMHGYTVEEMVTLSLRDLAAPEDISAKQQGWTRMLGGEWVNQEHYHRRKDGTVFPVELSAGLVEVGGERYVLCLGRDTTERHQARDLLIRSERLKAVAELATGVAHNFNNILQIMLGGVHLALAGLERGNLSDIGKNLQEVLESCRLGAETVKRLQEFARMGRDGAMAGGKVFDLSHMMEQAIEMSKPWWKANPEREGIKVSLHREVSRNCMVKGRESEIFEVALNLLKNATAALTTGGEVRVRTFAEGGHAVFQIQDDGVGIPRDHLGKIFDPFWTTKGRKGTGMGLASSYGIVMRHGGEIRVESEPGMGALFTVRLPLAAEAEEAEAAAVDYPVSFSLSILVVDDMEIVVRQMETGLKKAGQKVFTAFSGAQALKIVEETPSDLVLSDLGMPEINGWELGKAVKALFRQRGVPGPLFIILTGWGGQDVHEDKIAESGVDLVIQKPVDIPGLLETIQFVLESRRNRLSEVVSAESVK